MSSDITLEIVRYEPIESSYLLRSHILHPHEDITIICILRAEKANVLSVIEDHLLESISSTDWRYEEEEIDFSYVTEKYNHFLSNLAEEDRRSIHGLFSIQRGIRMMVSTFGDMRALIHESDGTLSDIQENTSAYHQFELISSGDILKGSTVILSSLDLHTHISEDFYRDIIEMDRESFEINTKETLSREKIDTCHIIRLSHLKRDRETQLLPLKKQSDIIRNSLQSLRASLEKNKKYQQFRRYIGDFFIQKNKNILIIFFTLGIIIFFLLVSYIISALFQVTNNDSKDTKNQLLHAQTLVEQGQKLGSNLDAFDHTMQEATLILEILKSKNIYPQETLALLLRIEAMKKEIYDIQTVDLRAKKTIVPFNPAEISPIGIFEYGKKINLIGKAGAITNYALGETLPKVVPYAPGEEAIDYASTEDGIFFILTESNRVMASRKSTELGYVKVTGQDTWEKADNIDIYNGNIYLTNRKEGQIYKHKPGINGYSQKESVLPNKIEGIQEIAIDGGFYVIADGGKILRILNSKPYSQSGLILNKIPGEYSVGKSGGYPKIIIGNNLKYFYILDKNRVWIFEGDAKKFQDIRSWNYIAQMEISTPEEIRNIHIPRDGLIYVVTELGVYDIVFEIIDRNIILRN